MTIVVHPLFGSVGGNPHSPKEFTLWDIDVDLAMRLNDEWHSVLPDTNKGNLVRNKHKAFYAFEFNGKYYAVGIWTDPVAANRLTFTAIELRRLAICREAPKNTATRMLKLMREDLKVKFPHISRAISYQAKDHHHGTIYKADNWIAAAESKYTPWHVNKGEKAPQTRSSKIRWERYL